jgi:hydroxyacylglutathione hydrolase
MTIRGFTFNPFQTNAYICESDGEAAIFDPSSSTDGEHQQLIDYIEKRGLTLRHILLTHAHIDHIFGCRKISEHFGIPIRMHRGDFPLLQHASDQAAMFGVDLEAPPEPGAWIEPGEVITVGSAHWRVLETPGHSPGSVSFYAEDERALISGDVLFQSSIGRTDLWQGSLPILMQSIFDVLVPLGEDVEVHPGHGPATTIGDEVASNPFLNEGFGNLG